MRLSLLLVLVVLIALVGSGCGCAEDHSVDGGGDAAIDSSDDVSAPPEVGRCGWDDPPIVIGSCWSTTFIPGCLEWVNRRAPPYAALEDVYDVVTNTHYYHRGEVACRGGGYRCARGNECFADGGCACGASAECGVGEVCVRYADGGFDCVCGVGPP
jgi:hypothetical protein